MYIGHETRFITKLFKNTNIKTVFCICNTTENHITHRQQENTDEYNKLGVNKLTFKNRSKIYIGQTGHTFKTRFQEHPTAIQFNKDNSKFANHILNIMHSYGTTKETMEILKTTKRSQYLDTAEKYILIQSK
jgi:hypothetical protein